MHALAIVFALTSLITNARVRATSTPTTSWWSTSPMACSRRPRPAHGAQWVHLADNTGEPSSASAQLVFDAVRLTRVADAAVEQPPRSRGSVGASGCASAPGARGVARRAVADRAPAASAIARRAQGTGWLVPFRPLSRARLWLPILVSISHFAASR
jgi:hypothetical protein